MSRISPGRLFAVLVVVTPDLFAQPMHFNMRQGVTQISQQVYDLHMTILLICAAIGVVVFGAMTWAIIRHRKSIGHTPARFHESTKVELLWTAIPFLILIGMAVPATRTLIAMENPEQAGLTVQVTGSQWKWHYKYFDQDLEYYSLLATPRQQIDNQLDKGENYLLEVDRPLVLPVGVKVRFLMTSEDVIHSWWVPDFAVKKDAIPGFINEAWAEIDQPGIYRGQCAELCGKDHGFMPIVVIAKPQAEFEQWLSEQQIAFRQAQAEEARVAEMEMSMEELMSLGEQTYQRVCAACHQANGEGMQGVFPALKDSPLATGEVSAHIDIVVNGKSGTAMQAFGNQLGLKELAAVITYERNAWGNDTGDTIQPQAIQAFMEGEE